MSSKYHKEKLKKAIVQASRRLFGETCQPKETHLYLTRKQYESDPDGWHDVLRQRGLPEDAIIIIPSVFDTKGNLE